MVRLALILYSIVATTLSGSFFIAALVSGYDTLIPIIIAVSIGAVIAIPVSLGIAKAIIDQP